MKKIITLFYILSKKNSRYWREFLVRNLAGSCGSDLKIYGRVNLDVLSKIHIGNNVSLNHNSIITAKHDTVTIGDNVVISSGAVVTSLNYNFTKEGPYTAHTSKAVVIKNNAWIGANAVIVPGITIHEHAVVAAGAVVTKDVEANQMVAGVPAKVIKSVS